MPSYTARTANGRQYTFRSGASGGGGGGSAPGQPTGLSANAASDTEIDLTWTLNGATATSVLVESAPDSSGSPGTFASLATLSGTATSYADTGLSASTKRWYRVTATNGVGSSSPSSTASATTSATPTVVLLEDFAGSTLRGGINDPTQPLWNVYSPLGQVQSGGLDATNHRFALTFTGPATATASTGPYWDFRPVPYTSPGGYLKSYVKSGTFSATTTIMTFRATVNVDAPIRTSVGADTMQVGSYVRQPGESDPFYQGMHWYHGYDVNWYANRRKKIYVTWKPQARVSSDSTVNWPVDPEHQIGTFGTTPPVTLPDLSEDGVSNAQIHYFDCMTRFYFDGIPFGNSGSTGTLLDGTVWAFDDFYLEEQLNAPDLLVSSVAIDYTGTNYEVTWAAPKSVALNYEVFYGASNLRNSNGTYNGSGTDGGSAAAPNNGYTGTIWQSPSMSEQSLIYFLIVPAGQSLGFQVVMTP